MTSPVAVSTRSAPIDPQPERPQDPDPPHREPIRIWRQGLEIQPLSEREARKASSVIVDLGAGRRFVLKTRVRIQAAAQHR